MRERKGRKSLLRIDTSLGASHENMQIIQFTNVSSKRPRVNRERRHVVYCPFMPIFSYLISVRLMDIL